MSPRPLRATMTLDRVSGRLVPAASTVSPMMISGMRITHDTWDAHSTMYHARMPIHTMLRAKVNQ